MGLLSKSRSQQESKSGNQLQTADAMYKYCVDNGYGSGWNKKWGIKHFQIIESSLMSGEVVYMTFIGLHNYQSATKHDDHFAYAITNRRILMAQKTMTGQNFQSVSIDNLNDITFKSTFVLGIITFDTLKEVFNIGLDKRSAQKINAKVHEVIDNIKRLNENASNNVSNQPPASAADEIKKFKELLDMGAITQDEFDAKKKELLDS